MRRPAGLTALALLCACVLPAQQDRVPEAKGIFRFTLEERTRWEERYGVNFGKSVNQQDMLSRLRLGARFKPLDWLTVSAMGQDARVPFFGAPAPNTMRDTIDLQEAYVELFGARKTGPWALFGREMLDYGESRVIGTPQWANIARTFDSARVAYRKDRNRFEVLMVSPVKVRTDDFNNPELGDRIWGTYNIFSSVWRGASIDAYALRHSQNRIGGWTGAGTLGTNSFGGRFYGPLPYGFAYSLEGIGQTGHLGLSTQRAYAWFSGITWKTQVWSKPAGLSIEYKVASGTRAGASTSATYDQLSPANHDKFGHEDLFGWRNLKTLKSLETVNVTKALAWNLMYTNHWLFSEWDALYNSQGGAISISKNGSAGSHVGQELDSFITYRHGPQLFGAGFGHFFHGEFIQNTTPHINPRYFYVFQQFNIK